MQTPILFASLALIAACTETPSSAQAVNQPGSWQIAFVRLVDVDVDGPYGVVREPAPEYPMRSMRAPVADPASCTPGCDCAFVAAHDECEGETVQTCRAWGGFVETCSANHTKLDCSRIVFESDEHTTGVCVNEDVSVMTEFGYQQIQRYEATLDRMAYN